MAHAPSTAPWCFFATTHQNFLKAPELKQSPQKILRIALIENIKEPAISNDSLIICIMRNLQIIRRSDVVLSDSTLPLTSSSWETKDSIICTFGPSSTNPTIELCRIKQQ